MATTVNIGGNTSGLDASLTKAQQSVGKATAGIGRGLATAIGSSLGPFGELIEKIDAVTAATRGAGIGARLMAGTVGAAMAAAAYGVIKAKEAWDSMRESQEEADKSLKRITESQDKFAKTA